MKLTEDDILKTWRHPRNRATIAAWNFEHGPLRLKPQEPLPSLLKPNEPIPAVETMFAISYEKKRGLEGGLEGVRRVYWIIGRVEGTNLVELVQTGQDGS